MPGIEHHLLPFSSGSLKPAGRGNCESMGEIEAAGATVADSHFFARTRWRRRIFGSLISRATRFASSRRLVTGLDSPPYPPTSAGRCMAKGALVHESHAGRKLPLKMVCVM